MVSFVNTQLTSLIAGLIIYLPLYALTPLWKLVLLNSSLLWFAEICLCFLSLSDECRSKPPLKSIQSLLQPLTPAWEPLYKWSPFVVSWMEILSLQFVTLILMQRLRDNLAPRVQRYLNAKALSLRTIPDDPEKSEGNELRSSDLEKPCAMCLQHIRPWDEIYTHTNYCQHNFHRECVKSCLQTNTDCPLDNIRYTHTPASELQNVRSVTNRLFVRLARSADHGLLGDILTSLPTALSHWIGISLIWASRIRMADHRI